jgi:glycosyltransferase involved in cell wall biosynthesis
MRPTPTEIEPRPHAEALARDPRSHQVVMLLENNPYPQDVRVRSEAESLVRAGHRVTVIAPKGAGQPRSEHVNGVNVVRFRLYDGSAHGARGFIVEYVMAAGALHAGAVRALLAGATVLHLHNPPDLLFPAGMLFRLAGRRVVFDHHDLFPETVEVKLGSTMGARLARACQRLTYAVADHVLATNASYAEVAVTHGGKPLEAVTIVRNGPPVAWTQMPVRHRPGALGEVRLVYLGAISSQDGVDGLAPVLALLCGPKSPIRAHLTVVGDGDGRPVLEEALARRGLSDHVTFTGRVPSEQVPWLVQDADVCVDPAPATDVNQRSTMTKIAEYMALGKPVVAYDLLETRRTAGGAALLVEPHNSRAFASAIAELARDPGLRDRLAAEARRRVASLTWEHSERELLAAYECLRTTGRARRHTLS